MDTEIAALLESRGERMEDGIVLDWQACVPGICIGAPSVLYTTEDF